MKFTTTRIGLAGLALSAAAVSHAAPLPSNLPNQVWGTQMSFAQVADNFTLAGTGTYSITSIDFWSIQHAADDYRGTISWTIFNANLDGSIGSVHSSAVATPTVAATGDSSGFGYAEYEFNITVAISLTAGDGYWLALHNGDLGDSGDTEMLWETSDSGDAPAGMYKNLGLPVADQVWLDTGNQHAFRIVGTRDGGPPPPGDVPEPGTLALLVGALLAAGTVRRQARKI